MFGGLEIKGASASSGGKTVEKEPTSVAATSGFSFLSSSLQSDSEPAATVAPASSGFSFISSTSETSKDVVRVKVPETKSGAPSGFSFMTNGDDATKVNDSTTQVHDEDPITSPASGFGFLSNNAPREESANDEQNTITSEETNKVVTNPVSSSFSFLGSPSSSAEPKSMQTATSLSQNKAQDNNSIFSMLSSNLASVENSTASTSLPVTDQSSSSSSLWGVNTKPPLPITVPTTTSDILLQANPSQPTGSGIVFGGAAKPKTVKKRARGKKIGVGSSATSALPTPGLSHGDDGSQVSFHDEDKDGVLTNLSDEAEAASNRAEEFIANKMSSIHVISSATATATSSYMGRYSGEKTVVEDYGETSSNEKDRGSNGTQQSDEYKKAAAAAEEAKHLQSGHRKVGFMGSGMSGGFSSLFKRSFSASAQPSRASPISNEANKDSSDTEKSHTSEQQRTELKVPTYGEPTKMIDEQSGDSSLVEGTGNDNAEDLELNRRKEEETMYELEREKELKEIKRKEFERQLHDMDMMKKKEAERIQREEADRRNKLKEEQERQRIIEDEAAKRRTPGYEMNKMIHQFSLVSQNTTCSISELREERTKLLEKKSSMEKQVILATQQISQAEAQQMQAAEQEDFELADHLAAVIEQHENEKKEFSQICNSIEELIHNLDATRLEKSQKLLSCFKDVQTNLKLFLEKQVNSGINDSTDLMNKFELDTKRLAAESERLNADLKTIERDEGLVRDERIELESSISEQTGEIEIMRDTARTKLNGINEEIEELRRQLAEKEMLAAEVKQELHGHEESIEQVRGTFSRQLIRLAKKEAAIEDSRKDWTAEECVYKNSRAEHEAEVTAHSEALVAHDNLISHIKEEVAIAEQLTVVIADEVIVTEIVHDDAPSEVVSKAQAEVLQYEAAVDEANQILMAAKAVIDSLQEEVSTIETRLPILEAEKNEAASKRDFKAAGKASKAIKEMNARKERCEEELSNVAIERLASAQIEVEKSQKVLEEQKSILHEKEKEGGRQRMIQLVKKMFRLEKLREDICGTGEEDNEGESIKLVGGFVLDSEIAALVTEGEALGSKFGGWNEIIIEFAENDSEEIGSNIPDEEAKETSGFDESEACGEVQTDDAGEVENMDNSDDIVDDNTAEVEIGKPNETDKVEALNRCKSILSAINQIESEIEVAIDEEDYDAAAELDDQIQMLRDEMKSLGLSKSEVQSLKVNDVESSNESKGSQATDKSYDIVSNKAEEHDLDVDTNDDLDEQTEGNEIDGGGTHDGINEHPEEHEIGDGTRDDDINEQPEEHEIDDGTHDDINEQTEVDDLDEDDDI